ncbi:cytochrome b [Neptunomonas antarctica]|uniref:Cytochrome b561 n=1 Tax=Neptunomonas antarctica TaxID=619304 RepID=A0A1N7KX62_9GAMM|nr:cytochrome b [Neptunomonas antarctica]SIS66232.1 cytochrome b561 [Neptunomonas antarctica]
MALIKAVRNQTTHYGWGSIALHWLMALAIMGMYPLGLYIDSLTYYDPEYTTVPNWHKSIGILVAIFLIIRLGWKAINPQPTPIESHSDLIKRITKLGHAGLYLVLITVLISGYLISTADGRAISVFDWFSVPALPELVENQEDIAGEIHFIVATTLISFTALHAIAALKHHFIDKDSTLNRMLGIKETP